MDALSYIIAFSFGAIVGSFLNVVSMRFNSGASLGGRSHCMSCGNKLMWYDLVPILSFFALCGSCRKCKSKISWQYPLLEFLAGATFAMIFVTFPPTDGPAGLRTLLYVIVTCLLLVIAAYDAKHKIIPDSFAYSFAAIALASQFFGGSVWFHVPHWTALIAGPAIALPFALIWVFSKGKWMGLGDAKLVIGIGWMLGLAGGVNAVIVAFWVAAVVSVVWLLASYRKFKPRTEIPFGPYLILGMYAVLIFGVQVLDVRLLWQLLAGAY